MQWKANLKDVERGKLFSNTWRLRKSHLIDSLQPPSVNGKNHFVGCSKWQPNEKYQHIYAPIPAGVDETTLFQFMNDKAINLDQETEFRHYEESSCFAFRHPRHGKQKKCSQ